MPIRPILVALAGLFLLLPAPAQAAGTLQAAPSGLTIADTYTLAQTHERDRGQHGEDARSGRDRGEARGRAGRDGRDRAGDQADDRAADQPDAEAAEAEDSAAEQQAEQERDRRAREGLRTRDRAEERAKREREREEAVERERQQREQAEQERREQEAEAARRQAEQERDARRERESTEERRRDRRDREQAVERKREQREQAEQERGEKEAEAVRRQAEEERELQERDARRERERAEQGRRDRRGTEPRAERELRARELRRRVQEREEVRTPAQELSRTQVQEGQAARIDGGARTLRRQNGELVVRGDDSERLRTRGGQRRDEETRDGNTRTIVTRDDGTQVITVRNRHGNIVQRSRRGRDGRERVIISDEGWRREPLARIDLGPLRITIPREHYIVDARRASRRDLERALYAPPVERVSRVYSLEEVRRFERVRDIMPRIDMSTITFDFDSALVSDDQFDALADVADIMHDMLDRNPDELFLLEGHTDAPGTEIYNLALSDRRAEAVAIILSDYYDVPPENLVTQGFGEAFLKIPTQAAERENRRVAVRRITPLVRSDYATY